MGWDIEGKTTCFYFLQSSIIVWFHRLNSSEGTIKELFSKYGTVIGFKYFNNDRRMGIVQMSTIAEGIEALIVSIAIIKTAATHRPLG